MFWHIFKYELLSGLRVKDLIFWLMLFPIVLGTLFNVAFGKIYEETTAFSTIPAAVVEVQENEMFHSVTDSIAEEENPLLSVTYTDEAHALELLQSGEVDGILYVGDTLSLTVAESDIEETILKAFVEQYNTREKIITDAIMPNPMQAEAVISALTEEVSTCSEIPLTEGNTDNMIQYFYNLIAMVALFGTMTGLHITINAQANLSALGARKCCSPAPKSVSVSASLLGSYLLQSICMILCVSYLAFVLKIDFGSRLPLVYLSAILGGIMGTSMGFFVGSLNRFSQELKMGISLSVVMLLCFLSGLMIGNMKAIIAEKMPWFNEINPAAVISDSFYCLNIYSDYERFTVKLITMLITSAVFALLGFIFTRRQKYASL